MVGEIFLNTGGGELPWYSASKNCYSICRITVFQSTDHQTHDNQKVSKTLKAYSKTMTKGYARMYHVHSQGMQQEQNNL